MAEIRIAKGVHVENALGKVLRNYEETAMNDVIFKHLDTICSRLLLDAIIEHRLRTEGAHQFTGNLINSIVVILFNKVTGEQVNYFAYDRLKAPIRREMTSITARGTQRKNRIHFYPDWQNRMGSSYLPDVVTDESYGHEDAISFAQSWSPETGKTFEICVAYTSEYAQWVNIHHHTVGYAQSVSYTRKMLRGMGFKKK
jgi:hypothetical protein